MSAPINRGKPAHSDPELYANQEDDLNVDIDSLPDESEVQEEFSSEPDLSVEEPADPSPNPDDYPSEDVDFTDTQEAESGDFDFDDEPAPEPAKKVAAKQVRETAPQTKSKKQKQPPKDLQEYTPAARKKVPQEEIPDRPIGSVVRPKTQSSEVVPDQRVLRKTSTVFHDLYQLMPANMIKNMGWAGNPQLYKVAHAHFYHTFDSNGRAMKHSSPTGNHFHELIPKEVTDPKTGQKKMTYVCGPAIREKRVFSQRLKRWVRGYEYLPHNDRHTHQVRYCHSQEIETRQTNALAATVIAQEEQKLAPIPGITG